MPAILSATHTLRISQSDLSVLPTPAPTRTWKPVRHIDVVTAVLTAIERRQWSFKNTDSKFDLAVNREGTRMF